MTLRSGWLAAVLCGMLGAAAWGQAAPGAFGPPGMPGGYPGAPAAAKPEPAAVEAVAMPDSKFSDSKLDDVLDFMKEKIPGFNAVIIRSPGASPDYPTVPHLTTKDLTVGQFLEFVKTAFPGVQIQRIDGPTTPLFVIRIQNMGGPGPNTFGFAPGPAQPTTEPTLVWVYRLNDVVNGLANAEAGTNGKSDVKKATDDILSLIQAAMEQCDPKNPPVLKIHDATQTLLFKGTGKQKEVLDQVLMTLQPNENDQQLKKQQERQMENETAFSERIDSLKNQLTQLSEENVNLRKQLKIADPATTQPQK